MACALSGAFSTLIPRLVERLENNDCGVRPMRMTSGGEKYSVIPSHFASLFDPQLQWWEECEFKIPHPGSLIEEWNRFDALIREKSEAYPAAVQNALRPDDNMTEVYRGLRTDMEDRLHEIFTQENYGRGVPVVICGKELSGPAKELLAQQVKTFDRDDLHRYNLSVLQQLTDVALVQCYQKHTVRAAKFMKKISEEQEETPGGPSAGVPILKPRIVAQTSKRVGVTLTPGPNANTEDFEDVDLVLINEHVVREHIPALMLEEGTMVRAARVRGIARENPLKRQRNLAKQRLEDGTPGGPSAGVPLDQGGIEMYVDYLSHKGVASDCAIRYPTKEWFQRNFLLTSSHELSEVVKASLQAEGVDVDNQTVNPVRGLWVLNAHAKTANDMRERQTKLLEVGPEGAPRRASWLRRADPDRFRHPKWNGSPECLTINWNEFREQFLYRDENREFPYMDDHSVQRYNEVGIHVIDHPSRSDCSAYHRHCVPCGGSSGEIFPCMICENWAHMGCSYGVEGGR
eukprot:5622962-Amphidinium_carterae.1